MDKKEEILHDILSMDVAKLLLHDTVTIRKHNGIEYEMVRKDLVLDAMESYAAHVLKEKEESKWVSVEKRLPEFGKKVWFRGEISWKKENTIVHFEDELTMEEEQLEYGQYGYLLKEKTDYIVTQSSMPKTDLCSEYITHWMPLPPPPPNQQTSN